MFLAFISAGYGASYSKLEYQKRKIKKEIEDLISEVDKETKARYSKLVYKLKKEGLVEEKNKNKKKFLAITARGREKLNDLIEKEKSFPLKADYPKEKSNYSIIVIFDIPESKKGKREWLRRVLRELDFEMEQKSVWLGKTKIPQKFLNDLDDLEISDYVEIFAVSKGGSLRKID